MGGLWRGAEGDETEAGLVDFLNLIPPPHLVRFASLIGLGTPSRQSRFARCRDETPVREGILVDIEIFCNLPI